MSAITNNTNYRNGSSSSGNNAVGYGGDVQHNENNDHSDYTVKGATEESNRLIYDRAPGGSPNNSLVGADGKGRYWGGRVHSKGLALFIALFVGLAAVGGVGGIAYFIIEKVINTNHDNNSNNNLPTNCAAPFGSFCGCSGDVPAYSNCNSDYTSYTSNSVNVTVPSGRHGGSGGAAAAAAVITVYTGMQFQCVEYSRRFLISSSSFAKYVTFGDVDGASDIFPLSNVSSIFNSSELFDFTAIRNGGSEATAPPQFGDLIIYPIQSGGFPFGHVAVVNYVDTERMVVGIGEQNWNNNVWPVSGPCGASSASSRAFDGSSSAVRGGGDSSSFSSSSSPQYAREIPLVFNTTSKLYSMVEPGGYIIGGWKRVGARIQ